MLALAKLSIEPRANPLSSLITPAGRTRIKANAWPFFASLSWAFVMYIFRWYPESIQPSLRSSMTYMYVNSQAPCNLFHSSVDPVWLDVIFC